MKRLVSLVVLCSLGVSAYAGSAPHPSVLTVQYQGKMVPVITVIGRSPVIQVENDQVVISEIPVYQLQRAERFGDGRVKLVRSQAYTTYVKPITFPTRFVGIHIAAELRSQYDLKGAFATVLVFAINLETGEPEVEQFVVQGLPDLPAGKDVPVKISPGFGTTSADAQYILQIFDNTGHEVTTSIIGLAWDYFAWTEKVQFQHALKQYLAIHPGEDRDIAPFITPKPVFDSGVPVPPSTVSATLKVTADGTIQEVELSDELDSRTTRCIFDALYGWMFYPQLKAGKPVPTEVTVPLKFD